MSLSKKLASALCVLTASACLAAPPDPKTLRDAVECAPRAGLPNFFNKIEKGGDIKIAYLGGSITAQEGWRVKSLAYFNKTYPNCKFKEVNAAIGGTGADLGILRLEHDVLRFKPDLLFVEFATNGGTPKSMEWIIRNTWAALPNCDICYVYTVAGDESQKLLEGGKCNRNASNYEGVADRYGVPSIHMGIEAAKLAKDGKLTWKADKAKVEQVEGKTLDVVSGVKANPDGKVPFANDGVHPYLDTGHKLYEDAIERSLPAIKEASKNVGPHDKLPEPAIKGSPVKTLPMDAATLTGPWTKLPKDNNLSKSFANRMDELWKAEPGATLSFKFKGSDAYIYNLLGPDCGKLEITVDGKKRTTNMIDAYCTYWRLALLTLANDLKPDVVHEISVTVLPEKLDKSKILFPHNLPDLQKNPAKYEGLNFYAGCLFISGEIEK